MRNSTKNRIKAQPGLQQAATKVAAIAPIRSRLIPLVAAMFLCFSATSRSATHYLGISVEKHRWRSTLSDWRHSRDWIARGLHAELGLSSKNTTLLTDPSVPQLTAAVKELSAHMSGDDLVIIYLGTHQLKNGRILFGDRTETDAQGIFAALAPIPARTLLLADVCYAQAFERVDNIPQSIARVYAADHDEKAPNIELLGKARGVKAFYQETLNAYAPAPKSCSQMGVAFMDALRLVKQTTPQIPIPNLVRVMSQRQSEFAIATRTTRTPKIRHANLQAWHLAPPPKKTTVTSPKTTTPAISADPFAELMEVLSLPDQAIDPARTNFLIGKIYDPKLQVDHQLEKIDALAETLREKLGGETSPTKQAAMIADTLYRSEGFVSMPEPYPEDFLLHVLLKTKRGRCAALVSLYLALAHRLELPYQSYCVPEHVLIRTTDDAATPLNLETTLRGIIVADEKYTPMTQHTATLKQNPFYLQPQTRRQHAGTLLSPLASALHQQGKLDLAERAARLATTINPNDAEAWNNLGMTLRLRNDATGAKQAYSEALRIYPGFAEAWNNLGVLQANPADKITHFRKAIAYKPSLGLAWKNLAIAYDAQGQPQLAWAAIRRCMQLKIPLSQALIDRVKSQQD